MKFIRLSLLSIIVLLSGCTDDFEEGDIKIEDAENAIIIPITAKVAGHAYGRNWNGTKHDLGSVKLTFTKGRTKKTVWTSALAPVGSSKSYYKIWLTPGYWSIKAEKSGYFTLNSGVNISGPNDGVHSYYHFNPILKRKLIITPIYP